MALYSLDERVEQGANGELVMAAGQASARPRRSFSLASGEETEKLWQQFSSVKPVDKPNVINYFRERTYLYEFEENCGWPEWQAPQHRQAVFDAPALKTLKILL